MTKIDFGYRNGENGFTIYKQCFASLKKKSKSSILSSQQNALEEVIIYLITTGEQNGFDVNAILEVPCLSGSTCFADASVLSEKITQVMLKRRIQVNSIDASMVTPSFKYSNLALEMLEMQINPRISRYDGKAQLNLYLGITE